jgi:hypothetical protein
MFEFLKKKKSESSVDTTKEAEEEKKVVSSYNFQTMPKKFRVERQVSGDARKRGMVIIVAGVLFLAGISYAFYYFIIVNPQVFSTKTPIAPVVSEMTPEIASTPIPEAVTPVPSQPEILIVEPAPVEEATNTPAPEPTVISRPAVDTDGDSLSVEEELILGTADNNLDSDGDGYTDGTELANGYNPAGDGKLDTNSGLKSYLYDSSDFGFKTYYPSSWSSSKIGAGDVFMFDSGESGYFQVAFASNPGFLSLSSWYDSQFSPGASQKLEKVSIKNGDGLYDRETGTIYAMDANRRNAVTISYSPGEADSFYYQNLFLLFAANFEFTK